MRVRASVWATILFSSIQSMYGQAPPVLDPSIASHFRVTTFATGLNYPNSMQQLPDGSLLVATSRPVTNSFFNSTGELVRLVDADRNGQADGPPTVLATNLPGAVTSVRLANQFAFVTSSQAAGERLSVLRMGASPSDPFTPVGNINLSFLSGWEHTSFALAVRPTPGQPANTDLFFNIGSRENSTNTTSTVGVSGLINGTANGDAIYRVTVQNSGGTPVVSGLTQIADGLRNAAGIAIHPTTGDLYFQDNGIDTPGNRSEALSADELNRILAANIGGAIEDFGFADNYTQYRTGAIVGGQGVQPLVAFQPIPMPNGIESEGAVEIAFSPFGFPTSLQNGVFVGFHGQFSLGGIANEENPVVFYNVLTNQYFHFINNNEPNIGHPNGLLATADSLFIADMSATGSLELAAPNGVIYQIMAVPEPTSLALAGLMAFAFSAGVWIRRPQKPVADEDHS